MSDVVVKKTWFLLYVFQNKYIVSNRRQRAACTVWPGFSCASLKNFIFHHCFMFCRLILILSEWNQLLHNFVACLFLVGRLSAVWIVWSKVMLVWSSLIGLSSWHIYWLHTDVTFPCLMYDCCSNILEDKLVNSSTAVSGKQRRLWLKVSKRVSSKQINNYIKLYCSLFNFYFFICCF